MLILKRLAPLFLLVALALPVFAQAAPILPACDPPWGANPCGVEHLFELLINIYNYLLGLAGLVLLFLLIWGGFRMIIFYMSEDPEGDLKSAKLTIRRAITGFVIIACAYLIVNTLLFTVLGLSKTSAIGILLSKYF